MSIIKQILACTTDSATNNSTFASSLEALCHQENIKFKQNDQHIRCFAHIINLAAQEALKTLKASAPANEDLAIYHTNDEDISNYHIIPKVSWKRSCYYACYFPYMLFIICSYYSFANSSPRSEHLHNDKNDFLSNVKLLGSSLKVLSWMSGLGGIQHLI